MSIKQLKEELYKAEDLCTELRSKISNIENKDKIDIENVIDEAIKSLSPDIKKLKQICNINITFDKVINTKCTIKGLLPAFNEDDRYGYDHLEVDFVGKNNRDKNAIELLTEGSDSLYYNSDPLKDDIETKDILKQKQCVEKEITKKIKKIAKDKKIEDVEEFINQVTEVIVEKVDYE